MGERIRPRASGYGEAGASATRRALKGFTAQSSSPNEDINWANFTLRQRGRMLYMSSPVAASAIKTNRTKVVGTALTLKAAPDREALGMSPEAAKDWAKKAEREFALWAGKRENCDAIGVNDFAGLQRLTVVSWLMSGDVFALFTEGAVSDLNPYSLRVHMVEADRVSTPMAMGHVLPGGRSTDGVNEVTGNAIYDGVEVNASGRIVAYHVSDGYPNQRAFKPMNWRRVLAFGRRTGMPNILQVMDAERPDQYRGVTYLAPVIESLLNISRYTQSELMAALIQSFFTAWIKTTTPKTDIPINEVMDYGGDGQPSQDGEPVTGANEYRMGPGTVLHLDPDEEVVFGNPNIPTQGFDIFFKVICKEIGAALEIPYDTLLKEFNASYSASRAALMEAWEGFRMRRQILVTQFCQPVYERWLAEAVALGRIQAPGFFSDPARRAAWCRARWIGPVQGQLDPVKEVKANILAVGQGYKTHEQVAIEYGGDWGENVEQLGRENSALQAAGGGAADVDAEAEEAEEAPGGEE